MLGFVVRALIVIAIFVGWTAFVACEFSPAPRPHDTDAQVSPDAGIGPDSGPHGYFGREPSEGGS